MDINELRKVVDRMTPNQLQNFAAEAGMRYGVNQLLGKSTQEHLLTTALQLVRERMAAKGLKPLLKERKQSTLPHIITHNQKPGGVNGEVTVVKVGPEEMKRLWHKEGNHYDKAAEGKVDNGAGAQERMAKEERRYKLANQLRKYRG